MRQRQIIWAVLAGALVAACGSSSEFVSSWKSPHAKPLAVEDARVAAVVMMGDVNSRRSAEDKLAAEISARGAKGVPMYVLMPDSEPRDEASARKVLANAGVEGVVVMRPSTDAKTGAPLNYTAPPYNTYWNAGFYDQLNGQPWIDPNGMPYDTIVTVDTLIYSLKQNQLVWAGKSRKTNPASLTKLVETLADDTAEELQDTGLVQR